MRNLTPRTLRDKLFLFSAVLVLVPALVVGLLAERNARDSLQRMIGAQLARDAAHTAERLSTLIQSERDSLRSFAHQDLMRDLRVADLDKRVSHALMTLRGGHPARLDYLVHDAAGHILAASRPALLDLRMGELPGLDSPPAGETLQGPVAWPGDQRVLMLSTDIPDPDEVSVTLGRLVGLYDWPTFVEALSVTRSDLEGRGIRASLLLADASGAVLAASLAPGAAAPARLAPAWTERLTGSGDTLLDEDAGALLGRARMRTADWTVVVRQSLENAFAPARRLRDRIALTAAVALAVALGGAALVSRRVVHPLAELTLAIQGLARRDASILRVPVRTSDEVGALSEAFNHMASELERVQHDLIDAEKFAFVGQLASGVAHEVRTSLGVLRSSAQILERTLPDDSDPQAQELVQMMRAEVDRLGRVVDDLLTLGRSRQHHPAPTPISEPLERAVELVEPRAREKGVAIALRAEPPVARVLCDPEMIQEVAVNLLVNAVEALGRGGRIEVATLAPDRGFAGFEVKDDGAGVPEALRDRIFQPFVTAREGGVGLGLTFVKRVVHEHQGRIQLEPGTGRGACFRVELPLACEGGEP
ncbi:MAG: sensor histidine kinase [Myxococcota bacterium]